MSSPLVRTKLFLPRLRCGVLARSRLTTRLQTTAQAKLTLVSAPAGFGKTTAVAAWLGGASSDGSAAAWVSLEDGDGHAATFWSYVVAALQSVLPEVGCTVQPLLQSGHPPTRAALATLVNEVGAHPVDVNLVLDDYHLADSPEVADGMMYLLDHQPPNLHVVVITRADPELPLARLRARGELVEIRARDLRFTVEEVAAFLDRSGHVVGAPQVATLAARTEGWAAALRLASLSMEGRDDVAAFVAGFAGDDRYLIDYLVEEVLSRQPDDVRDFLLSTAVLDRLTGDLCDALTGRSDGATMLQTLERANLFVIPLDDRRRWYRYHHLFSDVLRAHLDEERPTRSAALHRRASDWYAAAGDPVAAVQHALAAGQADRAADIVETVLPAVRRERREAIIRVWVDQIPDDVVRRRPVLAIGLVGGLMQANEFDPAEPRLREVEHWLPTIQAILATDGPDAPIGVGPPDPAGMTYLSREELARVPAAVQMYRAALALVHGDLPLTLACAGRCTAAAMPDDHLVLGGAAALSGLARWAEGELEAAASEYRISIEHLYRAGHLADVLGCTIALADIRVAQGRLGEAERAYREGLDLAGHGAAGPLRGAADMHVGLAELALERGDTESARTHLEHAHELGESLGLPQLPHRLRATSAALAAAEADPRTAVDLLTAAEQVYLGDFSPDVRPLRARRARVLISLGEVDAALRWADERRLTPTDDLTYLREFEHVTLAEVLLAQHRRTAEPATLVRARALLGRLLPRAEDGGRVSTVLDLLILTGLAAAASGDEAGALDALRRAVVRAEPTGHVRVFARHGATLLPLLDRMPADDDAAQFVGLLRSSCRAQTAAPTAAPGTVTTPAGGSIRPNGLVEPLSPRELEVLRLLASDLDGPEMARRLFVSLNTLRTHTKHIYAKLGVTNRRAAVRRAQELDLPLRGRANRSA